MSALHEAPAQAAPAVPLARREAGYQAFVMLRIAFGNPV